MNGQQLFYALLALGLILIFAYKLVALIRDTRDNGWKPIEFSEEAKEVARAAANQRVALA